MMRRNYSLIVLTALAVVSISWAQLPSHADECTPAIITTVAGDGWTDPSSGRGRYTGDGILATQASLDGAAGVAVGADGSLYIADEWNRRVRKVDAAGIITTVAGNGQRGYCGDGGDATQACLAGPRFVAVSCDGSLYIADSLNFRVRRVDPDGIITTVAGNGTPDYCGDGGDPTEACLNWPEGLALGADGSLYIADNENARIRKVDRPGHPDAIITTVAGNGTLGYCGDGGLATDACLNRPMGVAVGPDDCLYIADEYNDRIRKVCDGIITTVAGSGTAGHCGDGGPATEACLNTPIGIAFGSDGSLYIADQANNRIRRVDPCGIITTIAGSGPTGGHGSYCGDGGPATKACLYFPYGVAVGPDGSVYVGDYYNHRVRKVRGPLCCLPTHIHLPNSGWHMVSTGRGCDILVADCEVSQGGQAPLLFCEAANVWFQDPLVWYDGVCQCYRSCGCLPIDDDHCLRAFRGYWLYTFVDDVTLMLPPP